MKGLELAKEWLVEKSYEKELHMPKNLDSSITFKVKDITRNEIKVVVNNQPCVILYSPNMMLETFNREKESNSTDYAMKYFIKKLTNEIYKYSQLQGAF